jgi:hypothetical protein
MIISTLIFDASFTKALNYIAKIFSSGIFFIENGKVQSFNNNSYKAKMAFIGCFVVFQLLSPSGIYVILMNCFGTRKAFFLSLACDADGKKGMQLYRERCCHQKKSL